MSLRNRFYDAGWLASHRVGATVISIGNLTLGGTGKTPCVEYVARFCQRQGLRVAILSRGYNARNGANDEALLLANNLAGVPHLQGKDRLACARQAIATYNSDVLILDDGFQHRRLARDLDVVLVDATQPWGFGHLFPRGYLREPLPNLKRADFVLLTRSDHVSRGECERLCRQIAYFAPGTPIALTTHRPIELLNAAGRKEAIGLLRGQLALGFCGIGNPEAFRQTLEMLGVRLVDFRTFSDHHRYDQRDIDDLRDWSKRQPECVCVVTTEKDLVKLPLNRLHDKPLWALRIGLHFEKGKQEFEEALLRTARGHSHRRAG
ncbi:MAG: tetraacyldisaccharide 4'-kinase [Gemmatales bacterium]|nr:MAG: tetraacyldisaccharide 4'-kinase [Gemmatales bacterium]